MTSPPVTAIRRPLAFLAGVLMFALASSAPAQPADELIDKLLELSKQKKRIELKKDDDALRKLLKQRYNIALDELKESCQDFKKHLATKADVFLSGRHLLKAELALHKMPADKIKVLEKAVELVRWYEKRLDRANKDRLVPRADLLRTRYELLTLEIELEEEKRELKRRVSK